MKKPLTQIQKAHILKGRYVWLLTQQWDPNNPLRSIADPMTLGVHGTKKGALIAADKHNRRHGRNHKVYDIQRVRIK